MEIKSLNVEVSTVCNAKCSLCVRHRNFSTWKPKGFKIPKLHLDLDKFEILDWDNTNIDNFVLCGSFGDPIFHPDLFRLIDIIHKMDKKFILYTNGEPHNEDWWKQLAKQCNNNPNFENSDKIIFGIDGLDVITHEKYRGTSFDKIIRNVNAFVQTGGSAGMQFIVFKHNEHQISEIESFRKNLGLRYAMVINSRIYTEDVLEKPVIGVDAPMSCFAAVGEPAMDVDTKLHICCYSYIRHFFGKPKIEPYDTFKQLKNSVYFRFTSEMAFCKTCLHKE